jgi:hypothetical protein
LLEQKAKDELDARQLLFFSLMSPILTSVLLGLTAAGANVFGGAIIVQRIGSAPIFATSSPSGAGFMLATALVEMVPESIQLRARMPDFSSWADTCWSISSSTPSRRISTLEKRHTPSSSCIPTRDIRC